MNISRLLEIPFPELRKAREDLSTFISFCLDNNLTSLSDNRLGRKYWQELMDISGLIISHFDNSTDCYPMFLDADNIYTDKSGKTVFLRLINIKTENQHILKTSLNLTEIPIPEDEYHLGKMQSGLFCEHDNIFFGIQKNNYFSFQEIYP